MKPDSRKRQRHRAVCIASRWACLVVCAAVFLGCDREPPKPSQPPNAVNDQPVKENVLPLAASTPDPVEEAVSGLAGSSEPGQSAAVDRLVAAGTSPAVEALARFLSTLPEGDFRETVVDRASSITNPDSLPAALALLQSSGDAGVTHMAQSLFSRLAGAEAIQSVLDIYDASDDPDLHARLEGAVRAVSNEEVVPALIGLVSDPATPANDGMLLAGTQALRQIGTPPAADAIIERLNTETSDESRAVLAAEVVQISNPLAETSLQNAAAGKSQTANTPWARVAAIRALVNHPSAETREMLKLLQNDPDEDVRQAATNAAAEIDARFVAP